MKILILGANGFTGRRILKHLYTNHQVTACSLHPDILPEERYQFQTLDILNTDATDALLNSFRPDVITCRSILFIFFDSFAPILSILLDKDNLSLPKAQKKHLFFL